jgi:hypothetical protein
MGVAGKPVPRCHRRPAYTSPSAPSTIGIKFSKILCTVTLYSKYTSALTFENFYAGSSIFFCTS